MIIALVLVAVVVAVGGRPDQPSSDARVARMSAHLRAAARRTGRVSAAAGGRGRGRGTRAARRHRCKCLSAPCPAAAVMASVADIEGPKDLRAQLPPAFLTPLRAPRRRRARRAGFSTSASGRWRIGV
jgi:hypothetical protein